jgi:hypothetical protein
MDDSGPPPPTPIPPPLDEHFGFGGSTPKASTPKTPGSRLAKWKAKKKERERKRSESLDSPSSDMMGVSGHRPAVTPAATPALPSDTSEKKDVERPQELTTIENDDIAAVEEKAQAVMERKVEKPDDGGLQRNRKLPAKKKKGPAPEPSHIVYKKRPKGGQIVVERDKKKTFDGKTSYWATLLYWRKVQLLLIVVGYALGMFANEFAWDRNKTVESRTICSTKTVWVSRLEECPFEDDVVVGKAFPVTNQRNTINLLRAMNTLLSIMLVVSVRKFYWTLIGLEKLRWPKCTFYLTIGNSPWRYDCWIESAICILHCPPFIEEIAGTKSPFWMVGLTLSQCFRLYSVVAVIYYMSRLHKEEGQQISHMCNIKFTTKKALKIMYNWNPLVASFGLYLMVLAAGGFMLMVADNWYCAWKPGDYCHRKYEYRVQKEPFLSFSESVWICWLTFFGVGYGRSVPHSSYAKLVCVYVALMGKILVASITANILGATRLLELHERVHNFVTKWDKDAVRNSKAAKVIQRSWRYRQSLDAAFNWQPAKFTKKSSSGKKKEVTKLKYRSSHLPFILRMQLFDAIREWRQSRQACGRQRMDTSDTNYQLDLTRRSVFVLENFSKTFGKIVKTAEELGYEASAQILKGGVMVHSTHGPEWLKELAASMKSLEKKTSRVTSAVALAKAKVEYSTTRGQRQRLANAMARHSSTPPWWRRVTSGLFGEGGRNVSTVSPYHDLVANVYSDDECVQGGKHEFALRPNLHANCLNCGHEDGHRGEFDDGKDWCVKCQCCRNCCAHF